MRAQPRRLTRLAFWRWPRSHPYLIDGIAAALATAVNLSGTTVPSLAGYQLNGPDVWAVLLAVFGAAPLVLRRRFPFTVALLVGVAYYVQGFGDYNSAAGGVVVLFALYTVGAYRPVFPGLVLVAAEALASAVYLYAKPELLAAVGVEPSLAILAITVVQFPGVWVIGRAVGARRTYLKELEDRAERLEQAAAAEVRAALAEERARVARELHDVVAHHVSVMTVQATAARRMVRRDPERSAEAMRAVEETGRSALDEMRRIVGALRTADAEAPEAVARGRDAASVELVPQPGIAQLGELLDRAHEAGVRVELTTIGTVRKLPPSADLAIYRIVQEALTNTMKHAGPTEARVTVRYEADAIDVAVVDDGAGRPLASPGPGAGPLAGQAGQAREAGHLAGAHRPGHGLIGMRERVNLNGGTLRTGRRATGGFEVSARLPLDGGDGTAAFDPPARAAATEPTDAGVRGASGGLTPYDAVST